MFDASAIRDELWALKQDMATIMTTASSAILENSKSQTNSAAEQIKAALNELDEALQDEEMQVEKLIRDRPIAALGSAVALGIVLGLLLRRH
jgi:ElaB/YqjD/DUF883 family membrane-anchored ribosome-binding protein